MGLAITAAPIAVYLVAIAVADRSTVVSTVLYFSVPVLYFILVTVLREHPSTRSEADEFTLFSDHEVVTSTPAGW